MMQRKINFSGYEWIVKESSVPVGPGPNYFSSSKKSVWVDSRGRLHLRIVKIKDKWNCAEIYMKKSLGHGKYTFNVASDVNKLDKNIIFGLFTYLNLDNEIDIEFSRWGKTGNKNGQFVVQPFTKTGNMKRFNVPKLIDKLKCNFLWGKDKVPFECCDDKNVLFYWVYKGRDIPKENKEKARINLWLLNGKPPYNKKEAEVVIEKFEFKKSN